MMLSFLLLSIEYMQIEDECDYLDKAKPGDPKVM